MARKAKDDGHRMGKYCGYTLLSDGRVQVAPMYQDMMSRISEDEAALQNVLKAVVNFTQQAQAALERRKREWWIRTADDYAFDMNAVEYSDGVIGPRKNASAPKDTTPAQ